MSTTDEGEEPGAEGQTAVSVTSSTNGSQVWIPQQPQIQELTESGVQCGYDTRQVPINNYWLLDCAPVPNQEEKIDHCGLVLVQNARQELIPRTCEKRQLQILTQVDVNEQQGNTTVTPHVDVYTQQTYNPISANAVGFQYDPNRAGGADKKHSVLCGWPTLVGENKNNGFPCPKPAFGDTSRCQDHMNFELNTGGAGDSESSVSTSALPPLSHLDPYSLRSQKTGPIYSLPMSNAPLATSGGAIDPLMTMGSSGGAVSGGDTGPQMPNAELTVRDNAPKLSRLELEKFLTGLTVNKEGFRPINSAQLAALRTADISSPPGIGYYVEGAFATTTDEQDATKGFGFSSRYYSYAHLNDIQRRYLFRLSSLLIQLSSKYPAFSTQVFDSNYDSIASLEAKILAVIPRILDWEFANANDLNVTKDFFRKNVFKDGKLQAEGFFERFDEFRDEKDNRGNSLMHPYIKAYAFGIPQQVYSHPNFTLFRPPSNDQRLGYIGVLKIIYDQLSNLQFATTGVQTRSEARADLRFGTVSTGKETRLGSYNLLRENPLTLVNKNGQTYPSSDFEIQMILTEVMLTLLARLQFLGWLLNTQFGDTTTFKAALDTFRNAKFTENTADKTLREYADNKWSGTTDKLTGAPLPRVIRAVQFIIDWETKQGTVFPKPPALSLGSVTGQQRTIFTGNFVPPTPPPPVVVTPKPTGTFTINNTEFNQVPISNLGLSKESSIFSGQPQMNYGGLEFQNAVDNKQQTPNRFSQHNQQPYPTSFSTARKQGGGGVSGFKLGPKTSIMTKKTPEGIRYKFPSYLMGGAAFSSSSSSKKSLITKSKKKVRTAGCGGNVCNDKDEHEY